MIFQRFTVRSRFELASGAFAVIMLLPAAAGWWSLRTLSASADQVVATALVKQTLSLQLVSSTMRAVRSGSVYVSRPSPQLRQDFEHWNADAHEAGATLNREHLVSSDEAALIAHLDRQLSILESELGRAHRHVDLGETGIAVALLDASAPLEAAILADVEHLGAAEAAHVASTTSALRRSADTRMWALVIGICFATLGIALVARWVSRTVALPLGRLLAQAVELGHRNADAHTPPDSVPEDFRPLAVAMNEAAGTLTRATNAESAAREARHRADAANRSKSDFLARMSHELRTPLNSIIGFANVLTRNRAGHLQPLELEYLGRINKNGRHLLTLIDGVLDLSKVEAGRMTIDREITSIDELIADTIAELEGRVIASHVPGTGERVALVTDLPSPMAPLVTDRLKLKQMIINLVGNSLKFTEHGSVTVRVVTDSETAIPVRIDVADTGPGIPADRQRAVFEAFEQASASTASKFGGTGLGLAITSAFADLLGYRVTIESTVGVGSIFSIHLDQSLSLTSGLLSAPVATTSV
ncbi:MAG: ATP-binding protein [bacterium]